MKEPSVMILLGSYLRCYYWNWQIDHISVSGPTSSYELVAPLPSGLETLGAHQAHEACSQAKWLI